MDWLKQFGVFWIVVTLLEQVAVGKNYKKYIRFFTTILVFAQILELFGGVFHSNFSEKMWERVAKSEKELSQRIEEIQREEFEEDIRAAAEQLSEQTFEEYEEYQEKQAATEQESQAVEKEKSKVTEDTAKIQIPAVTVGRISMQEQSIMRK